MADEKTPPVALHLGLDEAEALHATLEDLLENGRYGGEHLRRVYRLLGWRLLAERGGSGLTAELAELARRANTLEEYESSRDEVLGPILESLERGENRDP